MEYSVRQGKGKVNVNCLEYRVGTNNMDLANFGEDNACVCRTKYENVQERTMSDNSVATAVNPQPGGLRHPPSHRL